MMLAAPVQRSLAVLDMAQAGRFAEIRILFAPQLRALVSAEGRQVAPEAAAHSASSVRLSGCAVSCGLASTGSSAPVSMPARVFCASGWADLEMSLARGSGVHLHNITSQSRQIVGSKSHRP